MTRAVMTSIARTCPACGATNTVVAVTIELRPFWRINCSRCGATIVEDESPRREAAPEKRPDPPAEAPPRPAVAAARNTAPRRRRRAAWSRCCSGMHMAAGAALGAIGTALLLDLAAGPPRHPVLDRDAVVLTAALELGATPTRAAPSDAVPADRRASRDDDRLGAPGPRPPGVESVRVEPRPRDALDRDPRLAMAEARTIADPKAAARAEDALDLSRRDRRELQRRLALAEHDPRLVDGIFGPATRAAITGWQIAAGLPPTGYLDAPAIALLEHQTEDLFLAWQAERERDRRRQRARTASVESTALPAAAGKCQRQWDGAIAYGQNVLCDFRGLRENVAQLLRGFERS